MATPPNPGHISLRENQGDSLLDLGHVMGIIEQSGRQVSVPAIMGNIVHVPGGGVSRGGVSVLM